MPKEILAIRVKQWLTEWDAAFLSKTPPQPRPPNHFYTFSLSASTLRRLSETYRRGGDEGKPSPHRVDPSATQRRHDPKRSQEIADYVRHGYPWSTLSQSKKDSGKYDDLIKPGWLPTAIVINILKPGDERRGGKKIDSRDVVKVEEDAAAGTARVRLPEGADNPKWAPRGELPPFEVIDGQHRLWAFEKVAASETFELPVVAFWGLQRNWQAYLFWIVNIKPKKISASLAFDLYPVLRAEEWLDRGGDLLVYRETRAQELVEALWSHPESPWHKRINMLGETGLSRKMVSQAAWIRALTATVLRAPSGKGPRKPAIFTAQIKEANPLPWTRAQEAALLIRASRSLKDAVARTRADWAEDLRPLRAERKTSDEDSAFYGSSTLINNDQGTNAFLMVLNDLAYEASDELQLSSWQFEQEDPSAGDESAVTAGLESLDNQPISGFLEKLGAALADFDWRSSSAPNLTQKEQEARAAFRGTSGYGLLYQRLVAHLAAKPQPIGPIAKRLQ